jgi:hypothetical protein
LSCCLIAVIGSEDSPHEFIDATAFCSTHQPETAALTVSASGRELHPDP